jgi:hypothetical protein
LNRFAHRFDAPIVAFDLSELVNDIYHVSLRFAAMKKVTIEFQPVEERLSITSNPYRLQFAIFSCLQLALDNSDTNDSIKMNLRKEGYLNIITISSRNKRIDEDHEQLMTLISSLISIVDGKFDDKIDGDQLRTITITLPISI